MYRFPPSPAIVDPLIKVGNSGFTDSALDRIAGYGDVCVALRKTFGNAKGMIGFGDAGHVDAEYRVTDVAWLQPGLPETEAIYLQLMRAIQHANSLYWRYDLDGFNDEVQYCVYSATDDLGKEGHFTWHMDLGDKFNRPQRKLAITVQLSEYNKDYTGGEFYVFDGRPIQIAGTQQKGSMCIFPTWVQHAVAPVTSGVRKTLVAWACGPMFR